VVLVNGVHRPDIRELALLTSALRRGYALLVKDNISSLDDLAHVVVAASEGGAVADSAIMNALLRLNSGTATSYHRLSTREVEVLDLRASGYRNKAIATSLRITDETVERHIQSIYAKIGDPPASIQPRAHAVAIYQESTKHNLLGAGR
jgi:DNA-binding NarL/FixJ family response regulator